MKQVFTTLLFSCFAAFLFAQSPRISVQGTLKDANNVTVSDGTYELTFKLYETEVNGTAVFEEVGEVNVKGGIYTYLLGSVNTLNPSIFGKTLYLGITVNGTELTPRGEMTYAPYAMAVNTAIYADTARFAQNIVGGDGCKGAIGDIKYSILPLTQFQSVNGDCWVLMDGAALPVGNPLRNLTTVDTIPDGRGLFMRAHDERTTASGERKDPDRDENIAVATFQDYAVRNHGHKSNYDMLFPYHTGSHSVKGYLASSGPYPVQFVAASSSPQAGTIQYGGGSSALRVPLVNQSATETRPKNLNFYLYIRIE